MPEPLLATLPVDVRRQEISIKIWKKAQLKDNQMPRMAYFQIDFEK